MSDKSQKDALTASSVKTAKGASRRKFLKSAVLGAVAVTATAGLATTVAKRIPIENNQKRYLDDVLPGDAILASREYVAMTDAEKTALVKDIHASYDAYKKNLA
jgi:hypothetical protein